MKSNQLSENTCFVPLEPVLRFDDRVAGSSASHLAACADFELKSDQQCAVAEMENLTEI